MTKNENDIYAPYLEATIRSASAGTTVFADGSTYSSRDGYKSNGAPTRTRDSKPSPIVKGWRISAETVCNLLFMSLAGLFIALIVLGVIGGKSHGVNEKAVMSEITSQGAEVIGDDIKNNVVLIRLENGATIPCDVHYAVDNGTPKAFVGCSAAENTLEVKIPRNHMSVFDFKTYDTEE